MKIGKNTKSNFFTVFFGLLLILGLSNVVLAQTTYYSQGDGYFGTLSNWNTDPLGVSGSSPSSIGNDIFVIQDTHDITNDAIYTIYALTIEAGGSFINGESTTGQTININTDVSVDGTLDFYRGIIDINGDFTIGTTGMVTETGGATANLLLAGNLSMGGSWPDASGRFIAAYFNGSSDQSVSGAVDDQITFRVFSINKSGGSLTNSIGTIKYRSLQLVNGNFLPSNNYINWDNPGVIFSKSGGTFTPQEGNTFEFKCMSIVGGIVQIGSSDDVSFQNVKVNSDEKTNQIQFLGSGITYTILNQFEQADQGASVSVEGTLSYGSGATLLYFCAARTIDPDEWPVDDGPTNVTNAASANITLGVSRTVAGTFLLDQSNGNFIVGSGVTLTITGTLERQTIGTTGITGDVAYSGNSSTLRYYCNGVTIIGAEWPTSNSPVDVEMTITGLNRNLNSPNNDGRTVQRDLTLNVGRLSLRSGTLTVLGNVIGSEITGNASISDTTTLLIGNGTGDSEQQMVTGGSITLNKLIIDKAESGASASELTVLMDGAVFSFTSNGILTINAGILDLNGSSSFSGNRPATLTINSGGVLKTGGTRIDLISTINATSGKIDFTGDTQENLPTNITIGTVEVNNPAGVVTKNGVLTIGNSLVLTDGIIVTSTTSSLLLSATATLSGSPDNTKMLQGPLRKEFPGTGTFHFPVGTDVSSVKYYRPATFQYTAGDFGGGTNVIEIEYSRSAFTANTPPAGISEIATTSHYVLKSVANTPSGFAYNFTGTYENGNFTPETRNRALVETADSYTVATTNIVDSDVDTVKSGTFDAFPVDNQYIVFGAGGATVTWDGGDPDDDLWSSAENWDPDGEPTSTDVVRIYLSETAIIDASTDAVAQTLELGDGTSTPTLQMDGTLRIYQTGSTSLTVNDNATLQMNNDDGIRFGATGGYNSSLTNFTTSSTIEYQTGTIQADSYGNLVVNGASSSSTSGTIAVGGDFTKQSATGFTASTDVAVAGTYTNEAGNSTFNGGGLTMSGTDFIVTSGNIGGTVTFAGVSGQYISGDASPANFATLAINNSSGLTLSTPVQVSATLTLTDGLITTTSSNLMTLIGNASATGNGNSYVYGPLARTNATGSKEFPVGKSAYRPVNTNLTGSSPTVQFEVFDTPPNQSWNSPLVLISQVRYWLGTLTGTLTGGSVTLTYGPDDGVQDGPDLRVAYSSDNSIYDELTGSGSTPGSGTVNGTLVEGESTALGYFTLGTVTLDNSLPVELVSFTAIGKSGKILLSWQTASEVNNSGFEIYRSSSEDGTYQLVNNQLIPGNGNSTTSHHYEYTDVAVEENTTYFYKLYSRDFDGTLNEYGSVISATVLALPKEFRVAQNFPNPFNPTTRISFDVARESRISLEIYNMLGQKIRTLIDNEILQPGIYEQILWDAKDDQGNLIANGIYYLVFTAKDINFRQVRKMVFMK